MITRLLYIFKLYLSKIQCLFLKRIIWREFRYFSIKGFSEWKKKKKKKRKSWLRPNYYHFWKIIWITLLLEFNCKRTQETRPCKCKWFHVWGKSKALMLWMKMLQNITQLSYYYLPQSKGSWRARNWKLFFLLDFYFFPIRSVKMRKDYGCSLFLTNILVAIFFIFTAAGSWGKEGISLRGWATVERKEKGGNGPLVIH